jgi:hypothetical protein
MVVADGCRGKCPVLAHTGHHSAAETIELTSHAARAGADFAVVINPYYPPALYQTPGWQPMRGYTAQAPRGDFAGAQETAATLGPVRAAAALSHPHRLLPGSPGRTSPRPGRGRGR